MAPPCHDGGDDKQPQERQRVGKTDIWHQCEALAHRSAASLTAMARAPGALWARRLPFPLPRARRNTCPFQKVIRNTCTEPDYFCHAALAIERAMNGSAKAPVVTAFNRRLQRIAACREPI